MMLKCEHGLRWDQTCADCDRRLRNVPVTAIVRGTVEYVEAGLRRDFEAAQLQIAKWNRDAQEAVAGLKENYQVVGAPVDKAIQALRRVRRELYAADTKAREADEHKAHALRRMQTLENLVQRSQADAVRLLASGNQEVRSLADRFSEVLVDFEEAHKFLDGRDIPRHDHSFGAPSGRERALSLVERIDLYVKKGDSLTVDAEFVEG